MLYLPDDGSVTIKSFSSASRGGLSTVKIELVVKDPMRLGFLLTELQELAQAQQPKPQRKPKLLALPMPGAS